MDEDPAGQENDPPLGDLDAGLRDRLRRASGEGGDLTHAELLELAGALNRQRQQIAEALADLGRREAEAARVRDALEETSRDAELALDERDARLSALSAELEAERQRLAARAQELSGAEHELARRTAELAERLPPEPLPPRAEPGRSFEAVISELRARIERVEATLELRERLERVEAALAVRMQAVREQAPAQLEERLARLERLVDSLAGLLRQSLEAVPLRTARAREPTDAPREEPPPEDPPPEERLGPSHHPSRRPPTKQRSHRPEDMFSSSQQFPATTCSSETARRRLSVNASPSKSSPTQRRP